MSELEKKQDDLFNQLKDLEATKRDVINEQNKLKDLINVSNKTLDEIEGLRQQNQIDLETILYKKNEVDKKLEFVLKRDREVTDKETELKDREITLTSQEMQLSKREDKLNSLIEIHKFKGVV